MDRESSVGGEDENFSLGHNTLETFIRHLSGDTELTDI